MTNELEQYKTHEDEEPFIEEMCILAPKTYAMRIRTSEREDAKTFTIIKAKGFPLNLKNREKINLENFKHLMMDNLLNDASYISITNRVIRRKNFFELHTQNELKRLNYTYDKRVVMHMGDDQYYTVPYGSSFVFNHQQE